MLEFNPSARFSSFAIAARPNRVREKSSRLHKWYRGNLNETLPFVPRPFQRIPFENKGKTNDTLDVITTNEGLPIAVVSKAYSLVDHCVVADSIVRALRDYGIDLEDCEAEVYVGHLGAWFSFRVVANELKWDPGDGYPIAAKIAGMNSVDRTTPFRLAIGFFRYVCSNGIGWGLGRVHIVRIHKSNQVNQEDVRQAISRGVDSLESITKEFHRLIEIELSPSVTDLLSRGIQEKWGKTAARLLQRGWTTGKYRDIHIPGINVPCKNLWDIMNSLTWVASGQRVLSRQDRMSRDCEDIIRKGMPLDGEVPQPTSLFS